MERRMRKVLHWLISMVAAALLLHGSWSFAHHPPAPRSRGSRLRHGAEDIYGGCCAYVINLARRSDRLERVQKLLASTNPELLKHLERIDAVDGQNISLDSLEARQVVESSALARAKRAKRLGLYSIVHDEENQLVNFDDHFTEGAVACAMSHHKALTKVAQHPSAQWGLILEDDVSLVVPEVHRELHTILEQLPESWTAVFLGYHNEYGRPHPRAVNCTEKWQAAPCEKERIFEIFDHSWGLYAWMVKKEAAESLIRNLFPISSQVDYAISRYLITRHGGVYSVFPDRLLFYSPTSEEGQDSDIQTMRSEEQVAEEFGSWHEYMELQRPSFRPSSYGELEALEAEDLYDYGLNDFPEEWSD